MQFEILFERKNKMKKQLIVSVIMLVAPVIASAFPLFGEMENRYFPKSHTDRGNCADFSGQWKGTCTYSGSKAEANVKIEQYGCEVLNVGGQYTPIGGLESKTTSGPVSGGAFSTSSAYTTYWNSAK